MPDEKIMRLKEKHAVTCDRLKVRAEKAADKASQRGDKNVTKIKKVLQAIHALTGKSGDADELFDKIAKLAAKADNICDAHLQG